ncbi:MAG TPA: hypothetical protein VMF91_04165 [Bryobacteraceae bacterium]|nr:hypothetical protein [Bryobacteraceae bacterium]
MNRNLVALSVAFAAIAAVLFATRSQPELATSPTSKHDPLSELALIWDASESSATRCDEVVGLVEREMRSMESDDEWKGVRFTFFATGDGSSGWQPRMLMMKALTTPARIIDSQHIYWRERTALLFEVRNRCLAVHRTKSSPIYFSLARAADHLRSAGCGPNQPPCFIADVTDGQENRAFNWQMPAKLPPPIENASIHVTFCGFAQSVASRSSDPVVAGRLEKTWKALFTHPDLVRIEPFCPQ